MGNIIRYWNLINAAIGLRHMTKTVPENNTSMTRRTVVSQMIAL